MSTNTYIQAERQLRAMAAHIESFGFEARRAAESANRLRSAFLVPLTRQIIASQRRRRHK